MGTKNRRLAPVIYVFRRPAGTGRAIADLDPEFWRTCRPAVIWWPSGIAGRFQHELRADDASLRLECPTRSVHAGLGCL